MLSLEDVLGLARARIRIGAQQPQEKPKGSARQSYEAEARPAPKGRIFARDRNPAGRAVRGCRKRSGAQRRDHLRRRTSQQVPARNHRLRLRLLRLRPGRLARYLSRQWLAAGGLSQGPGARLPSVQEQSRRHLHRRDHQGGPGALRLGPGLLRGRLQQRRLERSVRQLLRAERALPQQRQRDIYRCDQRSRPPAGSPALELRLRVSRLRQGRPPRPVCRQLHRSRSEDHAAARGCELHLQGHHRGVRTAGPGRRQEPSLPQQRRRHISRCEREGRHVGHAGDLCAELRRGRSRPGRLAGHLRRQRFHFGHVLLRTRKTARSRTRPSKRAWPIRPTASRRREWAFPSATTTATACSTS